ncbi:MAG: chemotaxis-specific protein-glutamate methyltransferase CheB [Lachnospiraceae bacterium]|nr:chemotaxis-specific protein-glutamate methyltransferase CheB [Lachnospiraceae bacterium]
MKNILIVDDSALMRRALCDIINSDERFHVQDRAFNGIEALELLSVKKYDAVVLDINMPRMGGLELLKELQSLRIPAKVLLVSSDADRSAKIVFDALELGALDFVQKPGNALDCRLEDFKRNLLSALEVVAEVRPKEALKPQETQQPKEALKPKEIPQPKEVLKPKEIPQPKAADKPQERLQPRIHRPDKYPSSQGNKMVAIASSTGGPKALQAVIPYLPGNLNAPVVIVQHMPVGFTASLAERLDHMSEISVKEAAEGDVLKSGVVYIAKGGKHLNVVTKSGKSVIHYTDEPYREGVKPCANYMYESLCDSEYDQIVCVVMTGMGADGTKGIKQLNEKKKLYIVAQEASTCAVYGMPRSIVESGLTDKIAPLGQLAQEIIMNVGVK